MTDKDKIKEILEKYADLEFATAYYDSRIEVLDVLETLLKEREGEIAKDICTLIDEIESRDITTMGEWKQYKHIRNKIRDIYKVII